MIFKCELRFVAFMWPNLCLWVVILCPELKLKTLKTLKKTFKNLKMVFLNLGFYQPCIPCDCYILGHYGNTAMSVIIDRGFTELMGTDGVGVCSTE